MKDNVRFSLEVSRELAETLEKVSKHMANGNKSELLRKAILLMDEVDRAKGKGERLAFINQNDDVTARLILA